MRGRSRSPTRTRSQGPTLNSATPWCHGWSGTKAPGRLQRRQSGRHNRPTRRRDRSQRNMSGRTRGPRERTGALARKVGHAERNGPLDTGSVSAIDGMLATARAGLDRVRPEHLADEIAAGALIIDIRPVEQRQHDGTLDGALVVDRNVLEWRLDPSCAHHIPQITDPGQRIVVVCNEGYSSSLAAATLRDLGLSRATDLAGGFQAWRGHRHGS
jgi:rhodanese-related sulfurtransferase